LSGGADFDARRESEPAKPLLAVGPRQAEGAHIRASGARHHARDRGGVLVRELAFRNILRFLLALIYRIFLVNPGEFPFSVVNFLPE